MSTTGLKLGSLAIRTLAKPIASQIRAQARDHPHFRKLCINLAQHLHRIDMRLRLGILRDTAAIEKAELAEKEWHKKEALKRMKERDSKRSLSSSSNQSSSSPSTSHAHHAMGPEVASRAEKEVSRKPPPRIRPLSEMKAIENGANFISEFFLFSVAGGLILVEQIRSRRKEANRRDMVEERLETLEERNDRNEERLRVLEGRNREGRERILALEEESWRLKGGKGKFPGRKRSEEKQKIAEEKRLAGSSDTAKIAKDRGFWLTTWWLGKERVDAGDPDGNRLEEVMRKAVSEDTKVGSAKPTAGTLTQLVSAGGK